MQNREQIIELGRLLAEEQRAGCLDNTTNHGLERFVAEWYAHAGTAQQYPAVQHTLALLHNYTALPLAERDVRLSAALESLRDLFRQPPPQPPQPAPPPDPAELAYVPPPQGNGASYHTVPPPAPRPSRRKPAAAAAHPPTAPGLATPLKLVEGIPPRVAAAFKRIGVETLGDLLYHFPHRYDDYTSQKKIIELTLGEVHTIVGHVSDVQVSTTRNGRDLVEVDIRDESGVLRAVFFGAKWLARNFVVGRKYVFSGKVTINTYRHVRQMQSPDWEPFSEDELIHTGRLVPVHPLSKGLHERQARTLIKQVVDQFADSVPDHLPERVRHRTGLLPLGTALRQIHFPDSPDLLEQARTRLAFDEFLLIQVGVVQRRLRWQGEMGYPLPPKLEVFRALQQHLPFSLTGAVREDQPDEPPRWNWERLAQEPAAQRKDGTLDWQWIGRHIEPGTQLAVLCEIFHDLQKPTPMARLLQGDVGSGKTAVAAATMLQAVAHGLQAAIMAPTEILAEQHYKGLRALLRQIRVPRPASPASAAAPTDGWQSSISDEQRTRLAEIRRILGITEEDDLDGAGVRVALLTGSLTTKERRRVLEGVAQGEVDIVIGTHALISENVQYNSLGLVVIDEQHRFGVDQRERLKQKGFNPHMLVMTATPIPRTLTLTVYGELDTSIINKLPPGRQEIKTRWITRAERNKAYRHIRREIEQGRQAFVICPLVEESEKLDLPSAEEMQEQLQHEVFPELKVGLIHGRMLARDKDTAMRAFRDREFDILVATAVVEVGIDIPNATVIMIEGAERFGLAQLHQFRGRVGRGQHQSYCILVSDADNEQTAQRLQAMEETRDGFVLAEIDLKLRGPGEFLGKRQSGTPDLKLANLADLSLLQAARREAEAILDEDPNLATPDYRLLGQKVAQFWERASSAS